MRIIAGTLGGRTFYSPGSLKTHPMSDKIRGALFNILGDIKGLVVLDAFAGSGALSFEALSRGAKSATAIDNDSTAHKTILKNTQILGLGQQITVVKASASTWLSTNPGAYFDIIFCDPPYQDLQLTLIERLTQRLNSDGVLVLSWPKAATEPNFSELKKAAHRSYGDAQLLFFLKSN